MLNKLFSRLDPNLKRLIAYLPPYKGKFILAMIFTMMAGGTSSLIATLLGQLTDLGFYEKQAWVVIAAPIGLILIAALNGLCTFMSAYLLAKISQSVLITIRTQLFQRILYWPAQTYQEHTTGLVTSKFVNEANTALGGAAQSCITIIRDTMQVVALMGVLIYYNWQLTLVTLIIGPMVAFVLRKISKKMRTIVAESQKMFAKMLSRVQETYEAQRIVKVYNNYDREINRFEDVNKNLRTLALRQMKMSAIGTPATQVITMSGVAIVVAIALVEAQQGMLTMGEFITFLSAMLLIMPPLRHLAGLNATFASMTMAAKSIFETMDKDLEEDKGEEKLTELKDTIEFDHVRLRYPGADDFALKDFSLTVKKGEKIALVGMSGSGKSTVVNLLPRFWLPSEGEIRIDGRDYRDYSLTSLRDRIAIVSQDVVLFDDTIRANIAYGTEGADEASINQVIDAAALRSFIDSLPQGLDTPVGEAGSRLSGGQKQRISIARALLKNADIVILDEATSALDSESEAHIKDALENLMVGRTCFTVAHRLSTIEQSDRIVVMANGDIQEIGSHQDLLQQNGMYARLTKLQNVAS